MRSPRITEGAGRSQGAGPRRCPGGQTLQRGARQGLWRLGGRIDHQSTKAPSIIARIAGRAHGVVTRDELLRAGISAQQIRTSMAAGSLIKVHPGVYRVGHAAPSCEATNTAAVKACGPGAALAGAAAAHLLSLTRGPAPPPEVIARTKRHVHGVRVRRCRLGPGEVTLHRGIAVTTVARTLIDLAAVLDIDALAAACHEAGVRYRTTPGHVKRVLARHPNAKGAARLRQVLDGDAHVTLSVIERRFLERLREAGLPLPVTNKPAGGRRVDCRWPERRLTVELDSYTYHRSRHAWERDRRREREAHARGDDFRRYTHGDVMEEPEQMMRELHGLLEGGGRRARLRAWRQRLGRRKTARGAAKEPEGSCDRRRPARSPTRREAWASPIA